jgi:DNA transformation protein
MSASTEYTEYVMELLQPIGRLHTNRFFGGVGISYGAVQFAMIMGNSLYLVVDDSSRQRYENAGMAPFSYRTKKRRVLVRRYFELPEDVLNDPSELRAWAREAIDIAKGARPKRDKVTPATANKRRLRSPK